MDYSYNFLEELQINIPTTSFWYQNLLQISDFVPFNKLDQPKNPEIDCYISSKQNKMNINKKMIEFLRRSSSWCPTNIENNQGRRENDQRCYKHMMRERIRRERQKDCYLALHSMLPMGTKKDKNSIVQIAAMEIQHLHSCRGELRRRKLELENKIMEATNYDYENIKKTKGTSKIRLNNRTSGIDSMIKSLRCSKQLGFKTTSTAELKTKTKIGDAE